MNIFLAIFLGLLFGFILQKAGATNPVKIINMLRLKDFHLMKSILFAIGLSSLLLFSLISLGFVEAGLHVSVKSAYIGVIVGGTIFGLGWAISGFCPGTSLVALGEGKKYTVTFILGGLLGAFLFMLAYEVLQNTFLFNKLGGKMTLAHLSSDKYPSLLADYSGMLVVGVVSIALIVMAIVLPSKK
jgi:uncharacterized membrane protein YedE/YeeE